MRNSTISLLRIPALATVVWVFCQGVLTSLAMAADEAPPPAAPARSKGELKLADDAPDRYVVVKGDTLWTISGRFLKDPWRWPDLWRMNQEQVRNPQRIYPGYILVLDRSKGEPQLKLATLVSNNDIRLDPKVRAQTIGPEIPSIAPGLIEPFLSQPLVVEEDGLQNAPHIVATQEDRVYLGTGNTAYVAGIRNNKQPLWQIYRPGEPLVDPETKAVLGYEAIYLGSARVTREGDPATVEVVGSEEEIGTGDRLVPANKALPFNYVPHAPDNFVKGLVISNYHGVFETGRNSIVAINRGTRDGIEIGNVLAVYRKGAKVDTTEAAYPDIGNKERRANWTGQGPDPNDPIVAKRAKDETKNVKLKLPDERFGLIMVFRVFNRVSYALVLNVSRPVIIGDVVQTP
jgi:LysM domain-containing protein